MRRWIVRLAGTLLLIAAVVPAGTASAKQYPTSFTGNDVTYQYTDSNGTQYITEIGGQLQTARRCRKNRAVSITFTNPGGATGTYGSATTDTQGVFIIQHPTLDTPSGTEFSVTIAERKVRRGKCLATQATLVS